MIPPLLAIFSWPIVAWRLFAKMDKGAALCWCIFGGLLLLPAKVKFDLPLLPAINKHSMPVFAAVALLFILSRQSGPAAQRAPATHLPGWLPRSRPILLLFVAGMIGVVMTAFTNSDRLIYGPTRISGLRPYDAVSMLLVYLVALLPMLLGRKYLASPEQHKTLLKVYCLAMLAYSIPALWEIRMSPQLNVHVYGYANGWKQHVRYEGYRPLVFLNHSLWLGMFTSSAAIAALAMSRIAEPSKRSRYLLLGIYLLAVLVLSKTITALLIALLLIPVVFLLGVRLQLLFAACIAGIVLLYPMLRGADLVPVDAILAKAESIDTKRAQSLGFRLRNEDQLLEKARERPLAGWGSWGRNRVYNEEGVDISVTDGTWIIQIGSNGWIGYVARFGMLTAPLILIFWRRKAYGITRETSLLCVIISGNLIDLIPNSALMPVTWLMAGALIGRLEYKAAEHEEDQAEALPTPLKGAAARYARPRPASARPVRGGGIQVASTSPYARMKQAREARQND
jgi:hypothetical protein